MKTKKSLFKIGNKLFLNKWTSLILSFFIIMIPSICNAFNPEDEALRIQNAYRGFKDISGGFIQKSFIKDLKRTDIYKGRFYIKASKFRWEYLGAKPQTIYITEDMLIIYQKNEKQAYITRFDPLKHAQSPIVLLGSLADIKVNFDIFGKDGILTLKPKKHMGNIAQIEVLTSQEEFPIKSLRIIDTLSNKTDIELKEIKLNSGIKDKFFEFIPPEDVSIIRQ